MKNIKQVELEITSNCNAACPGCARTIHKDILQIQSFSFTELQRIFPPADYTDVVFKFCGVLGDPVTHPEFVSMVDYIIKNNGNVDVSTNGSIGSKNDWERLGKISKDHNGKLRIKFCIDGHKETNHIYRVNTKFDVIERNLNAFTKNAHHGSSWWVFIVFDHNEHELDIAKKHAESIGLKFVLRTGMRNSYYTWVAKIGKKNNKTEKNITTTGSKEHSKKNIVDELDKFIAEYKTDIIDENKVKEITDSIVCSYVHEKEIFIASDLTMWPCCFLYDSAFKNQEGIIDKLNKFELNWNNLKYHSIEEIQEHPWFRFLIKESWNPKHKLHISRCIKSCAKNKAYQNEIKILST